MYNVYIKFGLPWWLSGKEATCQCRRCGSDPGRSHTPQGNKAYVHSYRVCAVEPRSCDACSPRAPESVLCNERSPCSYRAAAARHGESPLSSEDPARPTGNKNNR